LEQLDERTAGFCANSRGDQNEAGKKGVQGKEGKHIKQKMVEMTRQGK